MPWAQFENILNYINLMLIISIRNPLKKFNTLIDSCQFWPSFFEIKTLKSVWNLGASQLQGESF